MRRLLILLAAIAQAACHRIEPSPLARAADYLWAQQGDDGGWHSRTYGLLRSGQSLTPFVLEAVLHVSAPPTRVDRAIAFIRANVRGGALGLADSIPDYPNYATALAVSALCKA